MSVAGMPQRAKENWRAQNFGKQPRTVNGTVLSETLITAFFSRLYLPRRSACWASGAERYHTARSFPLGGTFATTGFYPCCIHCGYHIGGHLSRGLITKVKTINVFRNFSVSRNSNQYSACKKC